MPAVSTYLSCGAEKESVVPDSLSCIVRLMLLSGIKGGGKGIRRVLGLSLCGHEDYEIGYL